MATQGKNAFDEATFKFDNTEIGIIDVEIGEESSELDVSDTKTVAHESEFLAGKNSRTISFTGFHVVGETTLPTRTVKTFELTTSDEDANTAVFSGSCILLTKNISGARDGAVQVAYTGRINGALNESSSLDSES